MRRGLLVAALLLAVLGTACKGRTKKTNWSVALSSADTAPYGTLLAYSTAPHYFPGATIKPLPQKFRYTSITPDMAYHPEGPALLVGVGLDFRVSQDEMEELLDFARQGNEVIIFCSLLDEKLQAKLHCNVYEGEEERPLQKEWNKGEENKAVLTLAAAPGARFGHHGRYLRNSFSYDTVLKAKKLAPPTFVQDSTKYTADTTSTEEYGWYGESDETDYSEETLEYDEQGDTTVVPDEIGYANGEPNFLRFAFGSGHLTIHLAPLSLSNYFLLQKDNRRYLDGVWSSLPSGVQVVYWHEYYKRSAEASSFGMLWQHPATRWALILALIALLLYVLFESKRRQRIIPVVRPLENTSVAFVETVGRLYYNRGDHANLAAKMVQQFLEWVRNTHNLSTTDLNDELALTLARRSGRPEREAKAALYMANEVRTGYFQVTEEYLHRLYKTFQPFYDSTHS